MVTQTTFFIRNKIRDSLSTLQSLKEADNIMLAFSGGKDSTVLERLAAMAGLKCESHFHRTTLDPPELVRHIKQHYPEVVFDVPPTSMFALILQKGFPPLRTVRYCCEVFKESQGMGKIVLSGIRAQESARRAKYKIFQQCPAKAKIIVNPILNWTTDEIWSFIRTENLPYCCLYDEGFKRIGCVMCPMAYWKQRLKEAQRWPKFYQAFMRCFEKLVIKRKAEGKKSWESAEELMRWWMQIPEEVELQQKRGGKY